MRLRCGCFRWLSFGVLFSQLLFASVAVCELPTQPEPIVKPSKVVAKNPILEGNYESFEKAVTRTDVPKVSSPFTPKVVYQVPRLVITGTDPKLEKVGIATDQIVRFRFYQDGKFIENPDRDVITRMVKDFATMSKGQIVDDNGRLIRLAFDPANDSEFRYESYTAKLFFFDGTGKNELGEGTQQAYRNTYVSHARKLLQSPRYESFVESDLTEVSAGSRRHDQIYYAAYVEGEENAEEADAKKLNALMYRLFQGFKVPEFKIDDSNNLVMASSGRRVRCFMFNLRDGEKELTDPRSHQGQLFILAFRRLAQASVNADPASDAQRAKEIAIAKEKFKKYQGLVEADLKLRNDRDKLRAAKKEDRRAALDQAKELLDEAYALESANVRDPKEVFLTTQDRNRNSLALGLAYRALKFPSVVELDKTCKGWTISEFENEFELCRIDEMAKEHLVASLRAMPKVISCEGGAIAFVGSLTPARKILTIDLSETVSVKEDAIFSGEQDLFYLVDKTSLKVAYKIDRGWTVKGTEWVERKGTPGWVRLRWDGYKGQTEISLDGKLVRERATPLFTEPGGFEFFTRGKESFDVVEVVDGAEKYYLEGVDLKSDSTFVDGGRLFFLGTQLTPGKNLSKDSALPDVKKPQSTLMVLDGHLLRIPLADIEKGAIASFKKSTDAKQLRINLKDQPRQFIEMELGTLNAKRKMEFSAACADAGYDFEVVDAGMTRVFHDGNFVAEAFGIRHVDCSERSLIMHASHLKRGTGALVATEFDKSGSVDYAKVSANGNLIILEKNKVKRCIPVLSDLELVSMVGLGNGKLNAPMGFRVTYKVNKSDFVVELRPDGTYRGDGWEGFEFERKGAFAVLRQHSTETTLKASAIIFWEGKPLAFVEDLSAFRAEGPDAVLVSGPVKLLSGGANKLVPAGKEFLAALPEAGKGHAFGLRTNEVRWAMASPRAKKEKYFNDVALGKWEDQSGALLSIDDNDGFYRIFAKMDATSSKAIRTAGGPQPNPKKVTVKELVEPGKDR